MAKNLRKRSPRSPAKASRPLVHPHPGPGPQIVGHS